MRSSAPLASRTNVGAPGLEIADHVDDVVDPHPRQVRIDQFAAVLQDVLKMELGAVVLSHRRGEAATCDGDRAARGAALGHLDDRHAGLGALERGHGAGGAAADDEDVGGVANHRNVADARLERHGHLGGPSLAIATKASTHASANAASLMCSGSSSMRAPSR